MHEEYLVPDTGCAQSLLVIVASLPSINSGIRGAFMNMQKQRPLYMLLPPASPAFGANT